MLLLERSVVCGDTILIPMCLQRSAGCAYTGARRLQSSIYNVPLVIHDLSSRYIDVFERVVNIAIRCRLHSSALEFLSVPSHRLVGAGRQSFPVVGTILFGTVCRWTSSRRHHFRSRLKTYLFRLSFPDILSETNCKHFL